MPLNGKLQKSSTNTIHLQASNNSLSDKHIYMCTYYINIKDIHIDTIHYQEYTIKQVKAIFIHSSVAQHWTVPWQTLSSTKFTTQPGVLEYLVTGRVNAVT